jgi:hypothetical protein
MTQTQEKDPVKEQDDKNLDDEFKRIEDERKFRQEQLEIHWSDIVELEKQFKDDVVDEGDNVFETDEEVEKIIKNK